jgi:DNA-directed RNA polymerase specialized sigma24 family protein
MTPQSDGSVTRWIGDLKSGGDSAAQHLWERYFHRLVHLARARLRAAPRAGAIADEEDAALSAFDSFCRGATAGRFPRLSDRDDLWRLLVVITVRKVMNQIDHQRAQKRSGGCLVGQADLGGLDRIVGNEPGPGLAAIVVDEYRRLREALGDDLLRRVLDLRLEGYTREEIAARMGCAVSTVKRKLDMIRQAWLENEA